MLRVPLLVALVFGYLTRFGCDGATTYKPAAGFFVCPESKTCALTECEKCSIFANGAEETADEDGKFTFASKSSTDDNLSVSGDGGVAKCDDECECQLIGGKDVESCVKSYSLSIPEGQGEKGDSGEGGGGEDSGSAGDRTIAQVESESSSSNMLLRLSGVIVFVSAVLSSAMV